MLLETQLEERQLTSVALFNYAHSYAQSAVTLEQNEPEATHPHAPVNLLYFHAIELYLKALLVRLGFDLDVLKNQYGHRVRPVAELCEERGLQLSSDAWNVINLMADTDNVISSRYIRLGTHRRLPVEKYFETCQSLHKQIGKRVYDGSRVSRIPGLSR